MNVLVYSLLRVLNVLVMILLWNTLGPAVAIAPYVLTHFALYFSLYPENFVALLGKVFRTREIHKPEGLYLRRYYLSPRWSWMPFQIFLHNIRLSDDRVMHDHPFWFWSLILKGCYREFFKRIGPILIPSTKTFERLAPAGTLLRNEAEHIHRLEIIRPVWSLVIAGRPKRLWGFWPEGERFVDAATFLDEPGLQDAWPEDRLSDEVKRKLGIPVSTRPSEISEKRPVTRFNARERDWFTDSAKIPTDAS